MAYTLYRVQTVKLISTVVVLILVFMEGRVRARQMAPLCALVPRDTLTSTVGTLMNVLIPLVFRGHAWSVRLDLYSIWYTNFSFCDFPYNN